MRWFPKKKTLWKTFKVCLVSLLLVGMLFFIIAPFFTAMQGGY